MAECIIERTNNPGVPEDDGDETPPWCSCKNCTVMDTVEENICCGRQTCITNYKHFVNICLDQVLTVAIHQ